jgi:general stress protein 26
VDGNERRRNVYRLTRHLRLTLLVAVLVACACVPALSDAQQPPGTFPANFVQQLQHAKEIYLETRRPNGTRSSVAPVWFAFIDNVIWFSTSPRTYKARRVEHGSPIFVSAQGKDGPFIKTKAEIVKDGAMADRLGKLYRQKYWLAWLGLFRPSRSGIESGDIVLIRLTPAPQR